MKNIFYILLLLPTIIFAQYPSNSGQKITLGEQTTADGLVYRGVANDTNVITPFSDTSAYIILDTVNSKFYHYNRTTTYWSLAGGGGDSGGVTSFSAGTTGLTPSTATTGAVTLGGTLAVANGGTGVNMSSLPNNYLIRKNASGVFDTSSVYEAGGKVGIGLIPDIKLHIASPIASDFLQYTENASSKVSRFGIQVTSNYEKLLFNSYNIPMYLSSGAAGGTGGIVAIQTSTTLGSEVERMRVDASGNVGIGTASPTYKLDINASTTALNVGNSRNSVLALATFGKSPAVSTYTTASNYLQIGAGENAVGSTRLIGFGYSVTGNTNQPAYIGYIETAGVNLTKGDLIFGTRDVEDDVAPTERMRIKSNGNVGIGTPTPSEALHVVGNGLFSGNVGIGSTTNPYGFVKNLTISAGTSGALDAGLTIQGSRTSNDPFGGIQGYHGTNRVATIFFNRDNSEDNSGAISFLTSLTGTIGERMRIASNGNVGIGTTTPTARLHVKGSTPDGTASAFKIDNSGNTNLLNILNNGVATFRNISNSGAPATSGTTVNATLSIDNAFSVMTNIGNLSASPYSVWLQVQDKGNLAITYPLSLQPNGGKVGIGTASPDEPLHVVKSTSTTNSITEVIHVQAKTTGTLASGFGPSIGFWGALTGGNNVELGQIGAVNTNINGANGDLVFYTRPNAPIVERMRISSTGAVTINNLGSGTVTASSGTLTTSSDSTYKIDAGFIDSALDKVMNLKPRYFYWNDKSGLPMDVRQLGFYAQEVNSAIGEEAANTPKENIPWGINDRSLIAFLTKAIQEQQSQIDILKQEIINLKNK